MEKLAVMGGKSVVTNKHPHFVWPLIETEEREAVIRQLATGEISINDRTGIIKELENDFAKYHGVEYALSVNNGTSALYSAYFACNIHEGDEVIVPAYTFMATVTPLLHLNAVPVLCDGQSDTGNILPSEVLKKITPRTKAIVVTHMWGHPCEMDEIVKIAKEHKLYLIEDCSHAHGATYKGKKVGTFGDVSCFSLQGKKIIYAGEGGILITNNREIYERAILLGHYRKRTYEEVDIPFFKSFSKTGYGLKFRMHPLAAALAKVGLEKLDSRIKQRTANLDYLSELLAEIPGIEPPVTYDYVTRGAYYGYKPLFKQNEIGISYKTYMWALQAEGVEVHTPGSPPLNRYQLFQNYTNSNVGKKWLGEWPLRNGFATSEKRYKVGDFPNVEDYYSKILSLPTFTNEGDKEIIELYAKAFRKVYENREVLLKMEEGKKCQN